MSSHSTLACAAGAVTLFASAALAQNAPAFRVTEIGFGGSESAGISFFGAYQDPNGTNFPPSPGDTAEFPQLQFDSYVAFGGSPVTPDSFAVTPDVVDDGFDAQSGFFDEENLLRGRVTRDGGADSRINPVTGRDSVFFARLTVLADTPVTGTVTFEIDDLGVFEDRIVFFDPEGGRAPSSPARGFREFRVISQKSKAGQELVVSSETGRGTTTALFDVYDLYVEQVPAPGAAGLFGLAGIAALRRKR